MVDLLQAVMLPSELAVVKVKGHASGDEPDAVGNRNADELPNGPRNMQNFPHIRERRIGT